MRKLYLFAVLLLVAAVAHAQKSYKHASEYQVAVLDETTRVATLAAVLPVLTWRMWLRRPGARSST